MLKSAKKIAVSSAAGRPATAAAPFVPVSIVNPDVDTHLEIELTNACVVRLRGAISPRLLRAAITAGARLSTHLGNGAAATLPRHPNFIWAQLADDRLDAGFIADGFHLPADTFKAMLRAKGLARSYLISDTTAAGGLPRTGRPSNNSRAASASRST